MLASRIGSLWLGIARQIGAKHLPEQELEALIGGLMSGQGGVVSAEHAYELHNIIAKHGTDGLGFDAALDVWLGKYGHRGFNEFDVANPRWDESREEMKELSKNLGQALHTPQTAKQIRLKSELKLQSLPIIARKMLGWVVGKASVGFKIREQGKSALIAFVGMSRHVALEFGERMKNADLIDQRDDIFLLSFADIRAWAMGSWDGTNARYLVADRRQQMERWSLAKPPADVILVGSHNVKELKPATRIDGNNIFGNGVSPGIAHGIARKVYDPLEAGKLREGGILVARSTDPSWTPLFLSASGIIVEIGGYLSHGAIVAREFGLPAVVNAPGCFNAIKDGNNLTVDGNAGVVFLDVDVKKCVI